MLAAPRAVPDRWLLTRYATYNEGGIETEFFATYVAQYLWDGANVSKYYV